MTIIESHAHIWTTSDPCYPQHPDSGFHVSSEATPEDLFAAQKTIGGVGWTVIVQPRLYLWDISYVSQAVLDYPDKFLVIGRVDPMRSNAADLLRELMQRSGFRGIRLQTNFDPKVRWLDLAAQDPLWEAAADTRATIGLLIDWYQIPQAEEMARRHPDVTLVIDHFGMPDWDDPSTLDNLLVLAELPNVFVKVPIHPEAPGECYPYPKTHPFIERTLGAFGASRLMWGSNWPVCLPAATYEQTFRATWELDFLTDNDRAWIFENTARSVWRIPA